MNQILKDAVSRAVGAQVVDARPLSGGDISQAYQVALADGRRVFVKANAQAPHAMFACEADGLSWLAEAGALRVPTVLAVGEPDGPPFVVLELLTPGPRRADYDESLGRGLAQLHRYGAECFGYQRDGYQRDGYQRDGYQRDGYQRDGYQRDNYIATLIQDNTPTSTWAGFYADRRLIPMARRAVQRGAAPGSWMSAFERLGLRMPDLVGSDEPPARLHGDLWSGNLHTDPDGAPCLIDPAVYGGHREIDLAMLELFGSPSSRFWAAYDESYPLAPGRAERVALYQLFPLLVHVNLFGSSYVASVEAALGRYL